MIVLQREKARRFSISIACELVIGPIILFLDEPISGTFRRRIQKFLHNASAGLLDAYKVLL